MGDYKQYISAVTEERQRLFAWSELHGEREVFDVIRQVENAIKEIWLIEFAPDGGLVDSKWTFGVVMGRPGNIELWKLAGPVDSDPTTANSNQASGLACYAASLELLLMLMSWMKMSSTDSLYTQTWIDSSGAGRHLSNLLKKSLDYVSLLVDSRSSSPE